MPLNFSNNYQYNYKEWNDDLGLYLNDYGFRYFNPQLNQWHSIDPLAENYYALSSYTYVANNPIKYTDPDGRYIPELEANPSEAMYKLLAEIDKDGENCPECEPGTMLNTVTVTDYRVWDFMKKEEGDKDDKNDDEIPIIRLPENDPPTVSFVGAVPITVAVAPEAVAVGAVLLLAYYLYTHPETIHNPWVYNKDNSKNEKHGDGGRKMSKTEKQIQELQEQMKGATRKEIDKLQYKIDNIRKAAHKARKGEEHSKGNKR